MTQEQSSLFTSESGNHNVQQAQELVKKSQIETRLRLRWWAIRRRRCATAYSSDPWRGKEQASVSIKCCRSGRMYDHFRCGVALGDVDNAGSIFAFDTAVLPHKLTTDSLLFQASPPPFVASIRRGGNGEKESDSSGISHRLRGPPYPRSYEVKVMCV